MRPWNWYIADPFEIMCDFDCNPNRPATKVRNAQDRLASAKRSGRLAVDEAYLFPSESPNHFHMIVRLKKEMPEVARLTWELYLRGDTIRFCNNMARWSKGIVSSLLITREPYRPFYRLPNFVCHCPAKHSDEIMENCEVAERVRGIHKARRYFPKPEDYDKEDPDHRKPLRFGKMDLL